jgi:hypothetical protein
MGHFLVQNFVLLDKILGAKCKQREPSDKNMGKTMHHQDDPMKAFFEPSNTPILFIIGSLFLAVLGEGFYGLLEDIWGDNWTTRLVVVLVALAIFGTISTIFWLRVRQISQRHPAVPVGEQAQPHAGVVLLASLTPTSAEPAILAHHQQQNTLRHCWIIASPQVQHKAHDFAADLEQKGIRGYVQPIEDVNRIDMAYAAVQQTLQEATQIFGDTQQVIVDITGSTKVMTAGAVLACQDWDVAMEYMVTERGADGKPIGKATAMQITFPTRHIIQGREAQESPAAAGTSPSE